MSDRRPRSRLALLGLLVFSSALGLAILEAGVRMLRLSNVGTPYVAEDPDTIYSHIPGKRGRMESPGEFAVRFSINSHGMRSPEVAIERSDALRVVAIGDSFTFGVGAEQDETWPAVLGTRLRATAPNGAEVLNAGVQGWGLAEYWIWLDKRGARFRPDWIVLGIHRSDWTSAFREVVTLGSNGTLTAHPRPASGVARLKRISERIPFYETLMNWSALANYAKSTLAHRIRGGTTKNLENRSETPPWPIASTRAGRPTPPCCARSNRAQPRRGRARRWSSFRRSPNVLGRDDSGGVEPRFAAGARRPCPRARHALHRHDARASGPRSAPELPSTSSTSSDDGHTTPAGYRMIGEAAYQLVAP